MDYSIRPFRQQDEPFLWQMLYEAAHLVEEGNLTVQDAMNNPDLAKYVKDWGRKYDSGFIAILESSNQPSYDSHSHCTPPLNPLPASGEGRRSVALAGWGSSDLIRNQIDMI